MQGLGDAQGRLVALRVQILRNQWLAERDRNRVQVRPSCSTRQSLVGSGDSGRHAVKTEGHTCIPSHHSCWKSYDMGVTHARKGIER